MDSVCRARSVRGGSRVGGDGVVAGLCPCAACRDWRGDLWAQLHLMWPRDAIRMTMYDIDKRKERREEH